MTNKTTPKTATRDAVKVPAKATADEIVDVAAAEAAKVAAAAAAEAELEFNEHGVPVGVNLTYEQMLQMIRSRQAAGFDMPTDEDVDSTAEKKRKK